MLGYLFALLGAVANAIASLLQRRAGREEETERELSLRLVVELMRKPIWLLGVVAVTVGFLLQAVALGFGELSGVQPMLILDLPLSVLLARRFLGEPLGRLELTAIVVMTAALGGMLALLAPTGGDATDVPTWIWVVGLGGATAVIFGLMVWGRAHPRDGTKRAGIYGAATGIGFGITAALMKATTSAAQPNVAHVFVSWQLYLMVLAGAASMYLLQNAMTAGKLVAAQPGFTLADPIVAIVWGALVFHEQMRAGPYAIAAACCFALLVAAVVVLSRTTTHTAPTEPSRATSAVPE